MTNELDYKKIIGKTLSIKPFGSDKISTYIITKIERKFNYDFGSGVLYNSTKKHKIPLYIEQIKMLINKGIYKVKPFNWSDDTIEYKII